MAVRVAPAAAVRTASAMVVWKCSAHAIAILPWIVRIGKRFGQRFNSEREIAGFLSIKAQRHAANLDRHFRMGGTDLGPALPFCDSQSSLDRGQIYVGGPAEPD